MSLFKFFRNGLSSNDRAHLVNTCSNYLSYLDSRRSTTRNALDALDDMELKALTHLLASIESGVKHPSAFAPKDWGLSDE